METARERARRLAGESVGRGDPTGWFEELYAEAGGDEGAVQWADMAPNPHLVGWLERTGPRAAASRALVVGCGLGDDAEELARRGFDVVAFDVSPTAVAWCRRRFPGSRVEYVVADVLAPPGAWEGAFDLVVEVYTLQVLPPGPRETAMGRIAATVAPGGTLLVVERGREPEEDAGSMPWPLTRAELRGFVRHGLREQALEDYLDGEEPRVRRFRVEYGRGKLGRCRDAAWERPNPRATSG